MQAHNNNNQTGGGANDEALQVLATFASNATRSADDQSTSSLLTNGVMANLEHDNTNKRSMSSNSNHSNNNAGSEEDEGSSRSSGSSSSRGEGGVSKRTGLRKGKWTVSSLVLLSMMYVSDVSQLVYVKREITSYLVSSIAIAHFSFIISTLFLIYRYIKHHT